VKNKIGAKKTAYPVTKLVGNAKYQVRLQVSSATRAHHAIILTECNRSRLASLKFPFVLILAGTIVAL